MARNARVQQFTIIMEKSPHDYFQPTMSVHVEDNMVMITGNVSYTALNSAMKLAGKIARPRLSDSERRLRKEARTVLKDTY
jgi:hypothetical protein